MATGRDITIRRRARTRLARTRPACHICGEPIDYTLTVVLGEHGPRCVKPDCVGCVPHPRRFEADHIRPLALGGRDELDNFAASHRECNSTKRAREVAPIVRRCGSLN